MRRRGIATDADEGRLGDLLATDATDATGADDGRSDAAPRGRRGIRTAVAGWTRVFRRNRALWLTAGVAVVALIAGLVVGRFVVSPADAASRARPPEPGLVTAPVAFGSLSNDVTIRGEVGYADPVEVEIDTTTLSGPAVVTGRVPEPGTELSALSVALEVAGRPVIVLGGELPAYRTLRFGVSGPDVAQYKQAMRAVGLDAGDPANDVFDEQAARAVVDLYAAVGYPAPQAEEGAEEAVRAAEESLRSAEGSVAAAERDLAEAGAGPGAVAIREADNAVASARRALDAARHQDAGDAASIGDLQDALSLAELRRQQLDAAPDTSSQRSALDSARSQLEAASEALVRARQGSLPSLPAGEILPLTELPRRVDAVAVTRGAVLKGAAMTVSGATVAVTGSAAAADAQLLSLGTAATFELPDGTAHPATVSAVTPGTDAGDRWTIELAPAPLTPEQSAQVQGQNVRVSIPVGATEGAVLHVPVAALSAGPGGETRVVVVSGDPRDGERADTRLVVVETGLAAEGAVEVRPVEGELAEGDLVVVGR